jgi:hypothetical protein
MSLIYEVVTLPIICNQKIIKYCYHQTYFHMIFFYIIIVDVFFKMGKILVCLAVQTNIISGASNLLSVRKVSSVHYYYSLVYLFSLGRPPAGW